MERFYKSMLIKDNKSNFFYRLNISKNIIKNISIKNFLIFIILIQFLVLLFFFIFLVPHWTGFYKVASDYNKQNIIIRKILSLGYITKSIISSTKLKLGIIKQDLNIVIEPSDYSNLMNLRQKALDSKTMAIQKTTEKNTNDKKFKKYFKANFITSNQILDGKLRLKGDGLVHYLEGKWSMRVKLKNNTILGMKSFNLQHPNRRALLSSYIMHLFNKYENIPTKKFGLITVSVNDNPLGLYNYEELPTKEASKSFYGEEKLPIFLNDEFYMDEGITDHTLMQNEYFTNNLATFDQDKILSNSVLKNDFENAFNLFDKFRSHKLKTLDVFDEKTATFLALIDLFGGLHGLGFNLKFYYDRNTKKLTPTLWDAFNENISFVGGVNYGGGDRNFLLSLKQDNNLEMLNDFIRDKKFLEMYLKKINKITHVDYINKVFDFYKKDIDQHLEKLLLFYPQASVDTEINRLKQNIVHLNKTYFNVKNPIVIYRSSKNYENGLTVVNRKPYPVYINKLVNKKNNKKYNLLNENNVNYVTSRRYNDLTKPVNIKFKCPKNDCFKDQDIENFAVLVTKMGQESQQLITINDIKFQNTEN